MAQSDSAFPSTSNFHLANYFSTNSPPSPSNSSPFCAYLCAHCPSVSFPNMELLEQHQQHNHHQKENKSQTEQQQNDGSEAKESAQMDATDPASPLPPANSPTASSLSSSSSSASSSSSSSVSESMGLPSPSGIALAAVTCKKCPGGRTFASQEQLNIHYIKTHRDRPQYACVKCGASFSIKRELSTHHRIHSGEQPHKCLQCGKEFGTRQLLKKHSMWHIGKRSHMCPHCGKAFFQKGHLTQHLMIHSGDRPHQCELCDKTFIFKFDLNRHLKIHQERKFACKQCGKCFGEQTTLAEHRTAEGKCGGGKAATAPKGAVKRRAMSICGANAEQPATTSKSARQSENEAQNEEGKAADDERNEEETTLVKNESVVPIFPPNPSNSLGPPTTLDQQQMAIGRVFGQLLAARQHQPITTDQFFPCLLCPQKFCTQTAYLLHWGSTHMRSGGTVAAPQQQNGPKEDIAGGLLHHSDTSSASSPLKASPPFSAHPFDVPHSAHFLFPSVCANCEFERHRAAQCVRELADARAELHRLRALLLRVGAIFGVANGAMNGLNGAEPFLGTG